MFRPVFSRSNTPQRIPPYPSDPVFEEVKVKTLNGGSGQVESETFYLDPGIYEITIKTPLKANVNRIMQGDSIENSSLLGSVKQVQYNVLKTKCYAHYCNDYIEMTGENSSHAHLELQNSVTQTGTAFSGYGEYYVIRTKYDVDSKQATNINPPMSLRLPSLVVVTDQIVIGDTTTSTTTGWHIIAGYNANTIPIDLQKSFYSTKELVQV